MCYINRTWPLSSDHTPFAIILRKFWKMNQKPTKTTASSAKTEAETLDRGEQTSGTQSIPQDAGSASSTTAANTTVFSTTVPRLPFGPVQEASSTAFTTAMGTFTDESAHRQRRRLPQDGDINNDLSPTNVMLVTPTRPQAFLLHRELQLDTHPAQVALNPCLD